MVKRHKPKSGRVAVIGSKVYETSGDRRVNYKDPVGIDMAPGPGVDIVHNMEKRLKIEPFSHVDCCSVLEHTQRPWLVAENIQHIMERGSTLLVTVPFVWRVHGYPDDYWRFTKQTLPILFPKITWLDVSYYHYEQRVDCIPVMDDRTLWFGKSELAGWGVL